MYSRGGEKLSSENLLKAVKSGPPIEKTMLKQKMCCSHENGPDYIRVFTNRKCNKCAWQDAHIVPSVTLLQGLWWAR